MQVLVNVMEGLVQVRKEGGDVEPAIAESWNILENATRFIFQIRRGVYFHDDPCFPHGKGREVDAHDIVYCLQQLCEPGPENDNFWLVNGRIKGASSYYHSREIGDGRVSSVEGLRAIDDYTVEIRLEEPFAPFLYMLSSMMTMIYPHEAVEMYGREHLDAHPVGTGPFKLKSAEPGEYVALVRNENYWRRDVQGNQLPYLDGLMFRFDHNANDMAELLKGTVDLTTVLGNTNVQKLFDGVNKDRFSMKRGEILQTAFLGFQHQDPLVKDVRIRRAISMAIDRDRLANQVMTKLAEPAHGGLIPPFFGQYDAKGVTGIPFDPDKARTLLAEAGYPDGKGFPVIQVGFSSNMTTMATSVQAMLQDNLGITIDPVVLPFQDLVKRCFGGTLPVFLMGWYADYPDPEAFLCLFYGANVPDDPSMDSEINLCRYRNPIYDKLFEKATAEINPQKRFALYKQADQFLVDDVAALPLSHDIKFILYRSDLKNIGGNLMRMYSFTESYYEKE